MSLGKYEVSENVFRDNLSVFVYLNEHSLIDTVNIPDITSKIKLYKVEERIDKIQLEIENRLEGNDKGIISSITISKRQLDDWPSKKKIW